MPNALNCNTRRGGERPPARHTCCRTYAKRFKMPISSTAYSPQKTLCLRVKVGISDRKPKLSADLWI